MFRLCNVILGHLMSFGRYWSSAENRVTVCILFLFIHRATHPTTFICSPKVSNIKINSTEFSKQTWLSAQVMRQHQVLCLRSWILTICDDDALKYYEWGHLENSLIFQKWVAGWSTIFIYFVSYNLLLISSKFSYSIAAQIAFCLI